VIGDRVGGLVERAAADFRRHTGDNQLFVGSLGWRAATC
jgi:hypothetical protein